MVDRYGAVALVVAGLLVTTLPAASASSSAPAGPTGPAARAAAPPAQGPAPTPQSATSAAARDAAAPVPAAPLVSPDAAARTRMHECGHQWSALKKAGNVGTLTWKDFSATCLAVNR